MLDARCWIAHPPIIFAFVSVFVFILIVIVIAPRPLARRAVVGLPIASTT
jgi:hypothetical protein